MAAIWQVFAEANDLPASDAKSALLHACVPKTIPGHAVGDEEGEWVQQISQLWQDGIGNLDVEGLLNQAPSRVPVPCIIIVIDVLPFLADVHRYSWLVSCVVVSHLLLLILSKLNMMVLPSVLALNVHEVSERAMSIW